MSSTISNNKIITNFESSQKVKYDQIYSNTKILSNKEKYTLRKQFIQIIPSYLSQTEKRTFSLLNISNSKNQIEEYKKLQCEINSIKSKITELEISKRTKISKIESLRLLIRRIANDDCFAKSNNKINNNSISRERKTIQKKGNNCYQQSNNIDNSNNNISNNNISEDGESDEGASKGGCDIDCYPVNNNIHSRFNFNNNNESYDNNDSEINNFNFTDFDFSFMDNCFKYCKKNLHLSKEDLWTC